MSELTATAAAAPRSTSAAPGRGPLEFLGTIKGMAAQPAVARSLPMLMTVGVIGLGALVWANVSAAPGRDIAAGLPEQDKAAVVQALSTAGIDHEVDRDTGAIAVPDESYHQARMLLAAQGLPKSAPDGEAMISGLPLGASRAVEGERLRSAKELDLARTIEAIDAVQSARVHLALDTPSVFLRDRNRRAASVMLRLAPGRSLGDGQVQAIVHLVASSVSGLAPEGVSVVDQSGRLLSSGSGEGLGNGSDRQSVQGKIEGRYLQALTTLLTPILGAGNFTAEVHADVDFSEVQATREGFPQEASAVAREERTWSGAGAPAEEAAGIPGAMSNQAPTAATVAAAPGGKLDPKTPGAEESGATAGAAGSGNYKRNYAIGREVSVTKKATGDVKRLTVAVAIRKSEDGPALTKKELAGIESLVKGAVGFNAARGDTVALNALTFAPVEESTSSWWEATWISSLIRNVGALLLALLVIGVGLPMLRRKGLLTGGLPSLGLGGATAGSDAKMSTMEKELAAAFAKVRPDPADVTLSMIEAAPSYEARAVLIRNFVRENPARAALVIRDLLRNGDGKGVSKVG